MNDPDTFVVKNREPLRPSERERVLVYFNLLGGIRTVDAQGRDHMRYSTLSIFGCAGFTEVSSEDYDWLFNIRHNSASNR